MYVLIWKKLLFYYFNYSFPETCYSLYVFRSSFMPFYKMLQLCFHIGAVPFFVNLFSNILWFCTECEWDFIPLISSLMLLENRKATTYVFNSIQLPYQFFISFPFFLYLIISVSKDNSVSHFNICKTYFVPLSVTWERTSVFWFFF